MLSKTQKTIIVRTPKHNLKVNCCYNFIDVKKVRINKKLFSDMCKEGCRNYNKKYCCPPFSPGFHNQVKEYDQLFVLMMFMRLNQLDDFGYKEYHKLRVGNAVMKPRIEKVMGELEKRFHSKFLSTGACRLCKPCRRKLNQPCKHPDKMRFSLESLGVDCNDLSKKLFGLFLQWYENKKAPQYTSVICALPVKESVVKSSIIKETENRLSFLQ